MPGPDSILHLTTTSVEWASVGPDGLPSRVQVPVREETPAGVAQAAREALDTSGARRSAAVIVLGTGFVHESVLDLPPLARREVRAVLHRKAARNLELPPAEVLFASRAMETPDALASSTEERDGRTSTRWQSAALSKRSSVELFLELRRLGIGVKRVVSGRFARMNQVVGALEKPDEPAIGVDLGPESVYVDVIVGGTIVNQSRIAGNFAELPSIGLALVQEVRNLQGWWRKETRGQSIEQVVVLGAEEDRAMLLRQALGTAAPGARLMVAGCDDSELEGGRLGSLWACGARGPFDLDLSVRIPRRPTRVLAALAAGVLMGLGGAVWLQGVFDERLTERRVETALLNEKSLDLILLEEEQLREQARVEGFVREMERGFAARDQGLPFEDLLSLSLESLGRDAALLSFNLVDDGGGRATVTGVTSNDPQRAQQVLERAAAHAGAHPDVTQVEMDPPSYIRAGEMDSQHHDFSMNLVMAPRIEEDESVVEAPGEGPGPEVGGEL